MKTRIDVINFIVAWYDKQDYLEIGCRNDDCFKEVKAKNKTGVDPERGGTHRMTSDAFFDTCDKCFDIIFIDGDHHHLQVSRDLDNAIAHLRAGGFIVMHDCLPPSATYEKTDLCGTAWRVFAKSRERFGLQGVTGDFDYGVGVIRRALNMSPVVINKSLDELTYEDFEAHREEWMIPIAAPALIDWITVAPSI